MCALLLYYPTAPPNSILGLSVAYCVNNAWAAGFAHVDIVRYYCPLASLPFCPHGTLGASQVFVIATNDTYSEGP